MVHISFLFYLAEERCYSFFEANININLQHMYIYLFILNLNAAVFCLSLEKISICLGAWLSVCLFGLLVMGKHELTEVQRQSL